MTAAWRHLVVRLREAAVALGKASLFLITSGLATVILASPLMMLRSGFLVSGPKSENFEIGSLAGAVGAVAATALLMALFEQARLRDVGLNWRLADRRNLALGLAGGVGGGLLVTVLPMVLGAAELTPVANSHADLHNFVYLTVVIFIGSLGEELGMRGYSFQVLLRWAGPVPTVLLTSALFATLHAANPGAGPASLVNTFLFGAALGYAMWRSGSLWMPIGLHAGWNLTLPLFGANLSGFAYRLTIYEMNWKISDLWSGGNYGPEGGVLASLALAGWFVWIRKAPVIYQQPLLLAGRERAGEPADETAGASAGA